MTVDVFSVPIFFITFRETLETAIIVSVLLSFLKQTLGQGREPEIHKRLVRQVWFGIALGLLICLIIGGAFIGCFYTLGKDKWANTEDIWEGAFALFAAIVISIMGAGLLRVAKLKEKWQLKLARALEAKDQHAAHHNQSRIKQWLIKYAMFHLPFITVLREGLEAVVFIGGVSLSQPASSFPLAVVCGLAAGVFVGFLLYKVGNHASIQIFLVVSTCFLYLVAAGLFSRAVWSFENHAWTSLTGGDASETGSGPGSYDIRKSVWHVNCCNPQLNGGSGWGIFNAILGWQNSATYGSVISYNLYWVAVIIAFWCMRFNEKHGRWPWGKRSAPSGSGSGKGTGSDVSPVSSNTKVDATVGKLSSDQEITSTVQPLK